MGRQIDFAFHGVVQVRTLCGQHRPDFELASGEMFVAHDTLNFLLRGHADLLQEFPQPYIRSKFSSLLESHSSAQIKTDISV
jgi:hypothetical protein